MVDRESQSGGIELITDKAEKARVEAENALRQTKAAKQFLQKWKSKSRNELRPSVLLELHHVLMTRISPYPGTYRPGDMTIKHSSHKPPPGLEVPRLIEEMCDYVNENWNSKSAIHLAAYVMWRINWVHPFEDGNGRTARIVSHLVLSARANAELPGNLTFPTQIEKSKQPYYEALEDADRHWRAGKINVTKLEMLLQTCIARQLVDFFEQMGGKTDGTDAEVQKEIEEALSAAKAEGFMERHAVFDSNTVTRKMVFGWLLTKIEERPVLYGGVIALMIFLLGLIFSR